MKTIKISKLIGSALDLVGANLVKIPEELL